MRHHKEIVADLLKLLADEESAASTVTLELGHSRVPLFGIAVSVSLPLLRCSNPQKVARVEELIAELEVVVSQTC